MNALPDAEKERLKELAELALGNAYYERLLRDTLTPSTVTALLEEVEELKVVGLSAGAIADAALAAQYKAEQQLKDISEELDLQVGTLNKVSDKCAAAEAERDRMRDLLIQCSNVLKWLDVQGGLGFEKHKRICELGESIEAALSEKGVTNNG